ncbi:hypothetical protein FRC03_009194 [Tulasnella sp. 419]|nr:hypothetical protein FRC03_009194 [Tulasnella sp. 419]
MSIKNQKHIELSPRWLLKDPAEDPKDVVDWIISLPKVQQVTVHPLDEPHQDLNPLPDQLWEDCISRGIKLRLIANEVFDPSDRVSGLCPN